MKRYVVAITLDKVQSFLYQTFKTNTVENQKEADTLQKVIQASSELSVRFPKKIEEYFEQAEYSINKEDRIVWISGKVIFYVRLPEKKIQACLRELFRYYYLREIGHEDSKNNLRSKGQMRLSYTYFDLESKEIARFEQKNNMQSQLEDEIRAIRISTAKFKSAETMAQVIAENADTLFEFPKKNIPIEKAIRIDLKLMDGIFSRNIDELKCELTQYTAELEDEGDFFRVAVIKADLDGVGALFQSIQNYTEYKAVSEVLTRYICEQYFYELIKVQKSRKEEEKVHKYFKLLPLYVAGDDIFFITNVVHIFKAVDLLNMWLRNINTELEAYKKQGKISKDTLKSKLSLSVGVDVVAHSLPLRYMYDQVEAQLENAKGYRSDSDNIKLNISIYNQVFHVFKDTKTRIFDDDLEKVKKEKDALIRKEIEELKKELRAEGKDFDNRWSKFREEIGLIQALKTDQSEGALGFSYFYNLLEKSTVPQVKSNNQRYTNIILDHLMPDLKENTLNNQVKNVLLNQFVLEYDPSKKFKERKLMFNEVIYRDKFERKLRLYLLFSSERYKIPVQAANEVELKSSLILKPSRHLYNEFLNSEIARIFVKLSHSPKLDENGKIEKKQGRVIQTDYYQRVPIKTSMFHRLKKFYRENLIDKSAEAIFNVADGVMQLKIENKEAAKEKSANDREYDKKFEKTEFLKLFSRNKSDWNEDVIDSLMIFYKYIDVLHHWRDKE